MGKTFTRSFPFFLLLTSPYGIEKENHVVTYSINKHKCKLSSSQNAFVVS